MLAALASAALPGLSVSGVHGGGRTNPSDDQAGIDHAIVQDNTGRHYDVFASSTQKGRSRLVKRAEAARTLQRSRQLSGLGFDIDRVIGFSEAGKTSSTGEYCVLVTAAVEGEARPLNMLTLDDCASVGTALAAIHRQQPELPDKNRSYSTGQIRTQLTSWIQRLRRAGHVPAAITSSWSNIIETDGLWSFSTCFVHGGLADGDLLFSDSTICAITNWQNMQINDPARDLAWIFSKLDETHRDALMGAYGRMMGARLDSLILLRANLWLQMEQVGDFIEALRHADTPKIMSFKAQVEHLAHQLTVVANRETAEQSAAIAATEAANAKKSAFRQANRDTPTANDDSVFEDKTGSAEITKRDANHDDNTGDDTISRQIAPRDIAAANAESTLDDTTNDSALKSSAHPATPTTASATIVLSKAQNIEGADNESLRADEPESPSNFADNSHAQVQAGPTGNAANAPNGSGRETLDGTATLLIPILEAQERALRDAQEGLEEYEEREASRSLEMAKLTEDSKDRSNSHDADDSVDSDGANDAEHPDENERPNDDGALDNTQNVENSKESPDPYDADTPATA
jgi:hypothetical protein